MINAQNSKSLNQPSNVKILIYSTLGIYLFYILTSRLIEFVIPNYRVNAFVHVALILSISFGIMNLARRFGFHLNYSFGSSRGLIRILPMLLIGMWYYFLNTLPQAINGISAWFKMGAGKDIADILYGFSAGFWEETFLRGFLLAGLLLAFSQSKNAGMKAVIYSALIFGAMHITNLMNPGSTVIGVLQQMIYASIFGIVFGVIYLQTHTLLYGIIVHAVYDFTSFTSNPSGALAGDPIMPWSGFLVVFGSMLVMALIYLVVFRKHNQELLSHIKE